MKENGIFGKHSKIKNAQICSRINLFYKFGFIILTQKAK